eukprot:TRINITY_DN7021_c0_g1_i2.p1 TRINITY_DN7021_c0_g1~~TRINITY_DN7021_c0_g1_i2.p1  ORF type:complete len:120 (+),score=13.53 TRINITY_DN7021_c0_g1_i2:40-399(+)
MRFYVGHVSQRVTASYARLCDEATGSLDTRTESEILKAVGSLAKDRTSIFIAHRLTTAMQCDEIIVLEQGRVVEHGPHDELVNAGGRYSQLWGKQLQNPDNNEAFNVESGHPVLAESKS